MDDSKAALVKAYNAIRERYNKLRKDYRILLKKQTCWKCQQALSSCEKEQSDDVKALSNDRMLETGSMVSKEVQEIIETCNKLRQSVDDGSVGSDGSAVSSAISNLEEIAGRLSLSSSFMQQKQDVTEKSVSTSKIHDASGIMKDTNGTICSSVADVADKVDDDAETKVDSAENLNENKTEDLNIDRPRSLSLDSDKDSAPWNDDVRGVMDLAVSQYSELSGVCENLQKQNESLKKLMNQLLSRRDQHIQYVAAENEWSLLEK